MTPLDDLLQTYRDAAITQREKGTYLERLASAYLAADPVQVEEYSDIWSWSDWAAENGWSGKDVGIDLVAKLRNEEGFAAIQCVNERLKVTRFQRLILTRLLGAKAPRRTALI